MMWICICWLRLIIFVGFLIKWLVNWLMCIRLFFLMLMFINVLKLVMLVIILGSCMFFCILLMVLILVKWKDLVLLCGLRLGLVNFFKIFLSVGKFIFLLMYWCRLIFFCNFVWWMRLVICMFRLVVICFIRVYCFGWIVVLFSGFLLLWICKKFVYCL